MKLYATVTSERASKGQGGNKFIDIEFKNEKKETILELSFHRQKDGYTLQCNGTSRDINFHQFPENQTYLTSTNETILSAWDTSCEAENCSELTYGTHNDMRFCEKHYNSLFTCTHQDTNGNSCWNCESGIGECGENDEENIKGEKKKGKHIHSGEDCELSDCTICEQTVHRCQLDDNLQCADCK